jgi:hypothetical protein
MVSASTEEQGEFVVRMEPELEYSVDPTQTWPEVSAVAAAP